MQEVGTKTSSVKMGRFEYRMGRNNPNFSIFISYEVLSKKSCYLYNINRTPSLMLRYLIMLQYKASRKLLNFAVKHQSDNLNSKIRILMP